MAAGVRVHTAEATKDVLAGAMNAPAVTVFAFSGDVRWLPAFMRGVGAIAGGLLGAWLLRWVNDRALRIGIVTLGVALTAGLFSVRPLIGCKGAERADPCSLSGKQKLRALNPPTQASA
jgi:uncharacterized membrane protein YfcA